MQNIEEVEVVEGAAAEKQRWRKRKRQSNTDKYQIIMSAQYTSMNMIGHY